MSILNGSMATVTFSTLPPEIHVSIAEHCDTKDLNNLCLTSQLVNQRFIRALYRQVDLQLDPYDNIPFREWTYRVSGVYERQQQFVRILQSHPEYGKHVRSLKINDYIPTSECHRNEIVMQIKFWHAMQSLTHVRSVDLKCPYARGEALDGLMSFPNNLFPSAKSVRLAGQMQDGLARSILHAINPANLKHLCLDLVEENYAEKSDNEILGTILGPLKTLTGRCTALRTLILQRIGQYDYSDLSGIYHRRREAAEEASYLEWASFIRSVKGTVEEFTFAQFGEAERYMKPADETLFFRPMDERFLRLVLPTIVSGNWPCLARIELRGVRDLNGSDGKPALMDQLRAVVAEDTKIVVAEDTRFVVEEKTRKTRHGFSRSIYRSFLY